MDFIKLVGTQQGSWGLAAGARGRIQLTTLGDPCLFEVNSIDDNMFGNLPFHSLSILGQKESKVVLINVLNVFLTIEIITWVPKCVWSMMPSDSVQSDAAEESRGRVGVGSDRDSNLTGGPNALMLYTPLW